MPSIMYATCGTVTLIDPDTGEETTVSGTLEWTEEVEEELLASLPPLTFDLECTLTVIDPYILALPPGDPADN